MRAVLAAVAACALAAPLHAGAVPYAGVAHSAVATFRLTGSDRRAWQLEVEADFSDGTDSTGPYARTVTLRLTQCDNRQRCRYSRQWQQPLALDELSALPDGDHVVVTTRVLGRDLTATFDRGGGTGGSFLLNVYGMHVEYREQSGVAASLSYAGASCRSTDGYMLRRTAADPHGSPLGGGPAAPRTVPKGFTGRLRCR
ncbi:MAG TPA: hypothetical protein VFQ85_14460 [Mycobacteriales bacterium]|jgi:opacity protein-like surface antigen|nr:hypothetical protein [Mycobacteriales bacterium]